VDVVEASRHLPIWKPLIKMPDRLCGAACVRPSSQRDALRPQTPLRELEVLRFLISSRLRARDEMYTKRSQHDLPSDTVIDRYRESCGSLYSLVELARPS
jgi:hypothetical protein